MTAGPGSPLDADVVPRTHDARWFVDGQTVSAENHRLYGLQCPASSVTYDMGSDLIPRDPDGQGYPTSRLEHRILTGAERGWRQNAAPGS